MSEYAECHYADYCNVESRILKLFEHQYPQSHYGIRCDASCHYAECHGAMDSALLKQR